MQTCMTVKINAGKRTPPEVMVDMRSVNTKTLTMPNGATVTEDTIAQWIVKNLGAALNALPFPNKNEDTVDPLARLQFALKDAIEYMQHLRCCRACSEGDECLDYADKIREWESLLPSNLPPSTNSG